MPTHTVTDLRGVLVHKALPFCTLQPADVCSLVRFRNQLHLTGSMPAGHLSEDLDSPRDSALSPTKEPPPTEARLAAFTAAFSKLSQRLRSARNAAQQHDRSVNMCWLCVRATWVTSATNCQLRGFCSVPDAKQHHRCWCTATFAMNTTAAAQGARRRGRPAGCACAAASLQRRRTAQAGRRAEGPRRRCVLLEGESRNWVVLHTLGIVSSKLTCSPV